MFERHAARLESGVSDSSLIQSCAREQPLDVSIVFDAHRSVVRPEQIRVVDHIRRV